MGRITIHGADVPMGSGIVSLNGLIAASQTFATGTSGTDFAISSVGSVHTFNLPIASAVNTGKLSSTDWSTFNAKEPAIAAGTTAQYWRGDKTFQTLNTTVVPEGTNLYFTNERAQDAVGTILTDTASVDFTYDDAGNTISADVLPAGVDHNSLANLTVGDVHTQYALTTTLRSIEIPATQTADYSVSDDDTFIRVDTNGGAITVKLPDPSTMRHFHIKDVGGFLSSKNLFVARNGGENIEGVSQDKTFSSDYGSWLFQSDGTDWWIL